MGQVYSSLVATVMLPTPLEEHRSRRAPCRNGAGVVSVSPRTGTNFAL